MSGVLVAGEVGDVVEVFDLEAAELEGEAEEFKGAEGGVWANFSAKFSAA